MQTILGEQTISSLHIGHNSFELAAATADGPPFSKLTREVKSWLASGKGLVAKGLTALSLELNDNVLSDGEIKSFFR